MGQFEYCNINQTPSHRSHHGLFKKRLNESDEVRLDRCSVFKINGGQVDTIYTDFSLRF